MNAFYNQKIHFQKLYLGEIDIDSYQTCMVIYLSAAIFNIIFITSTEVITDYFCLLQF